MNNILRFFKSYELLNLNEEKYAKVINFSNLNSVKIECLTNIAVCSMILKDFIDVLEKTQLVIIFNNIFKIFRFF